MNIGNDNNKTMETNEKITDELIAKYISGKTNEEEDHIIHDYLAQKPEFANDLLDIATALRHQRKHDEEIHYGLEEQPKEAKRIFLSRRIIYSAAASIVLLIGVGFYLKTSTKTRIIQEQSSIAEVNTETSNTPTDPNGNIEETVLEAPAIINFGSEEVLFADHQATDVQLTENITEPQVDQSLFADNANPQRQQETNVPSADLDAPMMASMTIDEDNVNALPLKDAIFSADVPAVCNPDSALIMKWLCNAPKLVLEIHYGEGRLWEKTFDKSVDQVTFNSHRLDGFKIFSPQGFYWKMTGYYRDGTLTKEGFIRFTNDSN